MRMRLKIPTPGAGFDTLLRSTQPKSPGLRRSYDILPQITLPEGYQIRTYQPGDEIAWAEIIKQSFNEPWTAERCRKDLIEKPQFRPDGLFFATYNGKAVGTTCAWTASPDETKVGVVHMVGVMPIHQGKRLGKALVIQTVQYLRDHGFQEVILNTSPDRIAAFKTYINVGFEPVYSNEEEREKWRQGYAKLGLSELFKKLDVQRKENEKTRQ